MCDVIIDRAALDAIYKAGEEQRTRLFGTMQNLPLQLQISRLPCVRRKPQNQ